MLLFQRNNLIVSFGWDPVKKDLHTGEEILNFWGENKISLLSYCLLLCQFKMTGQSVLLESFSGCFWRPQISFQYVWNHTFLLPTVGEAKLSYLQQYPSVSGYTTDWKYHFCRKLFFKLIEEIFFAIAVHHDGSVQQHAIDYLNQCWYFKRASKIHELFLYVLIWAAQQAGNISSLFLYSEQTSCCFPFAYLNGVGL